MNVLWVQDISDHEREIRAAQQKGQARVAEREAWLDALDMPLWLRDAQGKLIWCNQAYARALGMERDAVIDNQKNFTLSGTRNKTQHQESSDLVELGRLAIQKGHPQEMQAHLVIDGQRRLMQFRELPLPGHQSKSLGIARDITREEELETEQQRNMTANRELLEQLRTAIAIYDSGQRLEFFNTAYAQLWGLDDKWLNTRPRLTDILDQLRETRRLPEQADFRKYKRQWQDMFTRLIEPHDDMMHLPDGTALRMLVIPHPMGGLLTTFEDVTSRLELESSYNTLIQVQKETLDNLAEGVAVFGGDGRVKLWNPAFAALWGLPPEALDGEPHITQLVEKMIPHFPEPDQNRARDNLMAQALNRTESEGRLDMEEGTHLDYATIPLPDGGVLVTHVDVTDTVQVENALREKNAALESAEQVKMDFLANVSYQLRTPLNAIMGFAEILNNEYFGNLNDRQKEYTESIHSAGARLHGLVDDILDLATIEAGYLALSPESFNIRDMLDSLYGITQDWARKQKIEVHLDCPGNVGKIEADQRRIKQVLLNLIRNAIAHTPEDGRITLKARRRKADIQISVEDTGEGINEIEQERVFTPFERAHSKNGENSTRENGGAGLGLTLVHNIVGMHGGAVDLESRPGEGTTVTVTLPLQAQIADADREASHQR
jgi:PAS domain S-box-containing protein